MITRRELRQQASRQGVALGALEKEEPFGLWEGQCQACDAWGLVDDLMLCEICAARAIANAAAERRPPAPPQLRPLIHRLN